MLLSLFLLLSPILGLTAGDTISPDRDEVRGTEGQTLTLTCQYLKTATIYPILLWYKQHSDVQAPQFLLLKGAQNKTNSMFILTEDKYESNTTDNSTELMIKKLTLEDSALYYCAHKSLAALTFAKPIRVTVAPADNGPVVPTLKVLKLEDQPGPNVCLASNFRPKDQNLSLSLDGGPVTVRTNGAVLSKTTRTYYFAAVSNRTIKSCEMSGGFTVKEADDTSENIYPEQAKQNFYLLMINFARVVFTKAVAFSTAFTIRDVLF